MTAVISVFIEMTVNASANRNERGTLASWVHEDVAAALDLEEADVAAIFEAMQGKVLDGNRLKAWERRQPEREDSSTERVRKHREKMKRSVTLRNAPEIDSESDSDIESDRQEEGTPASLNNLTDAVDAWNAMAENAGVPPVKGMTRQRRDLFAERVEEHGIGAVSAAIEAVGRSDFCRGNNDRGWRADFTFMLQPKHFVKLIEGGFDPPARAEAPAHKEPETREELERAIEFNEQYGFSKTAERLRSRLATMG